MNLDISNHRYDNIIELASQNLDAEGQAILKNWITLAIQSEGIDIEKYVFKSVDVNNRLIVLTEK